MKKLLSIFAVLSLLIVGGGIGLFYYNNLRGIEPALRKPKQDIAELLPPSPPTPLPEGEGGRRTGEGQREGENRTGMPLKLPPGFSIEVFAKDLPGARVMAIDAQGGMYVSRTKENRVTYLQVEKGKVVKQFDVFGQMRKPHGIARDPENARIFYIAQEDSIVRIRTESGAAIEKIVDLPTGGNHTTRTVGFGPDGRLFVSIGSSCNVCNEKDPRRAAIYIVDIENKKLIPYARGLRNSVFFTWNPVDGRMWATEMGRDLLGDDLPPDEINIVEQDRNYGWPICYGKNVYDVKFGGQTPIARPLCIEPHEIPSYIDLPAHSAPLGLAFIKKDSGWPKEYEGDLLVAFHGSWNRSEPTGYKITRIKLDAQNNYEDMDSTGSPQVEDFISGWLRRSDGKSEVGVPTEASGLLSIYEALGRPVDILVQPDGVAYISDDKAGVIYKVRYQNE